MGGGVATRVARAARPGLFVGRRARYVPPLIDETGEMVADYGIVALTNPAASNSGGTYALLIGGNLAPGVAAGPFAHVRIGRKTN